MTDYLDEEGGETAKYYPLSSPGARWIAKGLHSRATSAT